MTSPSKPHLRRYPGPWSLITRMALSIGAGLAGAAQAQPPLSLTVASIQAPTETADTPALPLQAQPPTPQPALSVETPAIRRIDIGSATQTLWALQLAARGTHQRSIDGEQASRSYERYLKSFETTIPQQFSTGMDTQK